MELREPSAKYLVRPGYTQTEVGVIPADWSLRPLGTIGKWFSGGTPSMSVATYWSGDIPWVSPKDMKVSRLHDSIDHITSKAVADGARLLPAGAILVVIRGMILAHSFPVARAERLLAFNQDIKAIVADDRFDSHFLLHWFTAHAQQLRGLTTESTHGTKRLPTEMLFRELVACPPALEQEAIAEALSDADALIESLEQLLAKKRHVKQGAMQELLTGKKRLPGFSGDWSKEPLGDLADVLKGSGLSRAKVSSSGRRSCVLYGELFTTYGRVITCTASRTDANEGLPSVVGDVLMPGSTTTTGIDLATASTVLARDVALGGDINVIRRRSDNFDPVFFAYYLTHARCNAVAEIAQGITIHHLYGRDLKRLEVDVPPLGEQAAIATLLSDMDAELAALEVKLAKARQIKQAMMQVLLTGRIRLV